MEAKIVLEYCSSCIHTPPWFASISKSHQSLRYAKTLLAFTAYILSNKVWRKKNFMKKSLCIFFGHTPSMFIPKCVFIRTISVFKKRKKERGKILNKIIVICLSHWKRLCRVRKPRCLPSNVRRLSASTSVLYNFVRRLEQRRFALCWGSSLRGCIKETKNNKSNM